MAIIVQSPTVVGVEGHDADVDLDVYVDDAGRPTVPRHRVHAALHEAASTLCDSQVLHVDDLDRFGRTRGLISNATIEVLRDPVVIAAVDADTSVQTRDAYTFVDVSTAVDPDGAPVAGSLRSMRCLRPGVVLAAPVRVEDDADLRVLARASLAWRQLGHGARRGYGAIDVLLDGSLQRTIELAAFGAPESSKADAAQEAAATESETAAASEQRSGRDLDGAGQATASAPASEIVDVVATTTRKLALGDGVSLPGAWLRGWLWANAGTALRADVEAGRITVGFGHPLSGEETLLPVPAGLRTRTGSGGREEYVDLLDDGESAETDRASGMWTAQGCITALPVAIEQRLHRAQQLLFAQRVMPAGVQYRFRVELIGSRGRDTSAMVEELEAVFKDASVVMGASRRAFGGGLRCHVERGPGPLRSYDGSASDSDTVDVVLAAPAIVRGERGERDASGLADAVLRMVRASVGAEVEVSAVAEAVSPTIVQRFSALHGGQRAVVPAAAAGSRVRLSLGADARNALAEHGAMQGIGECTADGFGQWYLAHPIGGSIASRAEYALVDASIGDAPRDMEIEVPSSVRVAAESLTPSSDELSKLAQELLAELPDGELDLSFSATLTLASDTTFGGDVGLGSEHLTELYRVPRFGPPSAGEDAVVEGVTLRATTLAGVMRAYVARHGGESMAAALFGSRVGADEPLTTSPLRTTPAEPTDVPERRVVRAHNRVELETGAVGDGFFALEVLRAGVQFPLAFEVRVPPKGARRDAVVEALGMLLAGLNRASDDPEAITLGMRTGRGRGRFTVSDVRAAIVRRGERANMEAWLTRSATTSGFAVALPDHGDVVPAGTLLLDITIANQERVGDVWRTSTIRHGDPYATIDEYEQRRREQLEGAPRPARGRDDPPIPRAVARAGEQRFLDSGTAFFAQLKRTAHRELVAMAGGDDAAQARARSALERVFGSLIDGPPIGTPKPARLRVDEPLIEGGVLVALPRNSIDPLLQRTVDKHLFTDEVIVGGSSTFHCSLRVDDAASRGVLWLALRALRDGDAEPSGSSTGIGHGRRRLAGLWIRGAPASGDDGFANADHADLANEQFAADFAALMESVVPKGTSKEGS